jgi:uncharacterized protein YdeI (BOF family)
MKLALALLAILLVSTAAIAADKQPAKVKPCAKGQVATTSRITGDQHCFTPQAPMLVTPVQPAKGAKVTAPVLLKGN